MDKKGKVMDMRKTLCVLILALGSAQVFAADADPRAVIAKLKEEIAEIEAEIGADDAGRIEDEVGDLLFAVVNLARHLKVDPDQALRRTNAKFTRRFGAIETALAADGRKPADASLDEMETLWQRAKAGE